MQLFRARLKLGGVFSSPLASGMIFGQLCWMLRDLDGEAALIDWLADTKRLWAISDAFPADHLPRPLLAPHSDASSGWDEDRKTLRGCTLITRAGFLKLREALRLEALNKDVLRTSADGLHSTARNAIDRQTGRARDEGGLFFRAEFWPRAVTEEDAELGIAGGFERDLYIEAPAEDEVRIQKLLIHLGQFGFGKASSLGRGRFTVLNVGPDDELAGLSGATRRLSLSRGTITANMKNALWRLEPHFGKTGPQLATGAGASPFKRPLLLTRVGATFTPAGEGRFGDWLREVHPTRPEVGHNAFHVAIPFIEAGHA